MASKSSRKGKKGERGVAEVLTEIIGVQFRRVPHSGSLRTHLDENFSDYTKRALSGDIMIDSAYQDRFPFSVECKNIKSINYLRILLDESRELKAFWKQAKDEAPSGGTFPILCLHTNRQPWIVFSEWGAERNWYSSLVKIDGEYIMAGHLSNLAVAIKEQHFSDLR